MSGSRSFQIAVRGDREIVMTRELDAPRELVFEACTRPALVRRWLGVFGGWTMSVCRNDPRPGGTLRYAWNGPSGEAIGLRGVNREVVAPARIVTTQVFDDPWHPGGELVTVTFEEREGRTMLTVVERYDSREIRDAVLASPMATRMAKSFANLEELLAPAAGTFTGEGAGV